MSTEPMEQRDVSPFTTVSLLTLMGQCLAIILVI